MVRGVLKCRVRKAQRVLEAPKRPLIFATELCMFTYMVARLGQDRRSMILDAGLAILREEGLAGFTQPNVAARAGLRQGNLTYYFATRIDLLAAVARKAVDLQLAGVRAMLELAQSIADAPAAFGAALVRHENTRVFAALNQAADREPVVQALFNEMRDGFAQAISEFLKRLALPSTQTHVDLLHAVFVGISVIDLATGRKNGKARAVAALKTAFALMSNYAA